MWLYILNIVTIPIYKLLIKDKKKFVILVALQLFLILALRDITLGTDLGNYFGGFNYIAKMDFGKLLNSLNPSGVSDLFWQYEYENGYTVLNWIVSHMGMSFHGLLVVCAGINISSVSYFIYRYSKKPWLSFIIFCTFGFYTSMFGLLRHSFALSMCLLSYIALDNKKYVPAVVSFVIALSFHRTAILMLPLLLMLVLPIKSMTRKRFLWLLVFGLAVLLLAEPIYNNIVSAVMTMMDKNYAGHDMELNKKIFLFVVYAFFMLFAYDFSKIKDKVDNISCYAFVLTIYFTIIGFYNANLTRALPFYSIFLMILIPSLFSQYDNQKLTAVIEVVTTIGLGVYFYLITAGTAIDPYIVYEGGLLW